MGNFVSVRGWLAFDKDMVPQLQGIIEQAAQSADILGLSKEEAEFYNRGWIFPEDHINWTYYCFYGADIRIQSLDYLRAQLKTIAEDIKTRDEVYISQFKDTVKDEKELLDYVEGVFFVDDEDEEISLIWQLSKGSFEEADRA